MKTKVKIGMEVDGEVASGTVIAMTSEWCVYRLAKALRDGTWEVAEPWSAIQLAIDYPKTGEEESSRDFKEL